MNRIEKLKNKVKALYERKEADRAEWADWLYENHIFLVAKYAEQLAKRFGVKNDLAVAASLLHDIADAIMQRENTEHEKRSNEIAQNFLKECNFNESEIDTIMNDTIKFHGCRNNKLPKSLEGKIMSSADAMAHLKSNFYDYALGMLNKTDSPEEIRNWALPKIEQDYRIKIFFDEIRTETETDYERVKSLFKT